MGIEGDSVDGCGMMMMVFVDERRRHKEDKVRERDDVFLLVLATRSVLFQPRINCRVNPSALIGGKSAYISCNPRAKTF